MKWLFIARARLRSEKVPKPNDVALRVVPTDRAARICRAHGSGGARLGVVAVQGGRQRCRGLARCDGLRAETRLRHRRNWLIHHRHNESSDGTEPVATGNPAVSYRRDAPTYGRSTTEFNQRCVGEHDRDQLHRIGYGACFLLFTWLQHRQLPVRWRAHHIHSGIVPARRGRAGYGLLRSGRGGAWRHWSAGGRRSVSLGQPGSQAAFA